MIRRSIAVALGFLTLGFVDSLAADTPRSEAAGGWYLLVPRVDRVDGRWAVLRQEPLSKWAHAGSYDTAVECEAGKNTNIGLTHRFAEKSSASWQDSIKRNEIKISQDFWASAYARDNAVNDSAIEGRCVASDDPRLR